MIMNTASRSHSTEAKGRAGQTVVVVGGNGGLFNHYRNVVEKQGLSLRHYERRLPPGVRRSAGKIALIVIMVGMVSHSLRDQVESLALDDAAVVYLRSSSVSALRAVVEQWST